MFIEALTYRFVGHLRSDPGAYRKAGELDEWRQRDPLTVGALALEERFAVSADRIADVDAIVDEQIVEMVVLPDHRLAANHRPRRERSLSR